MKLLPLALFSIALGLLTSVLAAFLFLIWFDAWWRRHEIDAHLSAAMPSPAVRCDGGMEGEPHHPLCNHYMRPREGCEMCKGLEKQFPTEKRLKAEQAFEKPAMKDGPLPKQFEDWWNKKNEEMS